MKETWRKGEGEIGKEGRVGWGGVGWERGERKGKENPKHDTSSANSHH